MIEIQEGKSPETLEIKIMEKVSEADLDHLIPVMKAHIAETADPRLLLIMEEFGGWDSVGAFLDELNMEANYLQKYNRIALVGDQPWEKWMTKIRNIVTAHEIKFFPAASIQHARKWLDS
jgi:hypothetical protein